MDRGGRHTCRWHLGRLSAPAEITDGAYTVEIDRRLQPTAAIPTAGRPQRWSHERQVKRNGRTRGLAFEMSTQLASGVETKWPP